MRVTVKPYRYVKAEAKSSKNSGTKKVALLLTSLCILLGVSMLSIVLTPLTTWQFTRHKTSELVMPIANVDHVDPPVQILGATSQEQKSEVAVKAMADGFSYFSAEKRLGRALPYKTFTVAIPTIGIDQALVVVNSEEFDTNLGHLSGTALPGEVGNVFVTGHSALPRFFSQTNYKTIFTPLTKLNVLDEVAVVADKKIYRYSVEKKTIVEPSDISVIDPPDPFGKYLTLMTCVPPGLNTKRLIVLARLIE